MTERKGFEPLVPQGHTSLAGMRFRPLSHLSLMSQVEHSVSVDINMSLETKLLLQTLIGLEYKVHRYRY